MCALCAMAVNPQSAGLLAIVFGMEPYPFQEGIRYVHPAMECEGEICCLHNPSKHHMRYWPMGIADEPHTAALCVRYCFHGLAHPDPDSLDYYGKTHELHECDGCCVPPIEMTVSDIVKELERVMEETQ